MRHFYLIPLGIIFLLPLAFMECYKAGKNRYAGKILLVIDPATREFEVNNYSTFETFHAQSDSGFVFPRDTVQYQISFFARPTPATPTSVFTNLDNELKQ